jgi:hypothetical protein
MPNDRTERRPWLREEVEATVADYFDMLLMELRGKSYNKKEHNRNLQHLLSSRTPGAIERKHQNISAVLLYENDLPYIDGYKPLPNVQGLLREIVQDRMARSPESFTLAEAASVAPPPPQAPSMDDILRAWKDPPVPKPRPDRVGVPPRPSYTYRKNYLLMEAQNSALGRAGEEFVLNFERARLIHEGCARLADRIEQISVTRGDGAGFDVLSFSAPGRERLIEVKTTSYGDHTPFFVSRNELEVSRFRSLGRPLVLISERRACVHVIGR